MDHLIPHLIPYLTGAYTYHWLPKSSASSLFEVQIFPNSTVGMQTLPPFSFYCFLSSSHPLLPVVGKAMGSIHGRSHRWRHKPWRCWKDKNWYEHFSLYGSLPLTSMKNEFCCEQKHVGLSMRLVCHFMLVCNSHTQVTDFWQMFHVPLVHCRSERPGPLTGSLSVWLTEKVGVPH